MTDLKTLRPFVSVVIPVRNEAGFIGRSLGAVLAQDYPHDRMEILIADGMSTDGTRKAIEGLQRTSREIALRILNNAGQIVASGLNALLVQARGDVIIRVDGHTIIAPNYVRECVTALQRTDADNVGGRMDAVSDTRFGQAVALATSSPFGIGGARFHYSDREEFVDTVYMGAWPREVFGRIGLFDEEMVRNQDDELNYRLRSQGGRILLTPRIRSQYYNRTSPRLLWRQYFQYGFWKVRVLQKHPRQMRPRQFIPALFLVALMISLALTPGAEGGRYVFGFIAGSYVLANVVASILQGKGQSWRVLPWLPITFATLHLAYGSGFLIGLIRFWNHWGANQSRRSKEPMPDVEKV
jgi:glycosyltransferase involved in cell wall biosynthesis